MFAVSWGGGTCTCFQVCLETLVATGEGVAGVAQQVAASQPAKERAAPRSERLHTSPSIAAMDEKLGSYV